MFDLVLDEPSVFNNVNGDDQSFGKAIDRQTPVIIGTLIGDDRRAENPLRRRLRSRVWAASMSEMMSSIALIGP